VQVFTGNLNNDNGAADFPRLTSPAIETFATQDKREVTSVENPANILAFPGQVTNALHGERCGHNPGPWGQVLEQKIHIYEQPIHGSFSSFNQHCRAIL
jgi:hypothetical protein